MCSSDLHARFERDEPQAALDFIDAWLPSYPVEAVLYGHLNWHAALCEIDLGRMDAAVARLLGVIEPHLQHALPLVGMTDTSSLLWRLSLQGREGLSWARAQAYAEQRFPQGGNAFVEAHLAMLAAAQRDTAALGRCRERLQRSADAGHGGAATALHWAEGLLAWCDGADGVGAAPTSAQAAIDASLAQAARLGGSHAQRTVIDWTRAASCLPLAGTTGGVAAT